LISLYMALFQFYNLNRLANPIAITRTSVMEVAKIRGLATYHKCMRDLVECGYIQYEPSFNPGVSSKVYLIEGLNCKFTNERNFLIITL